MALLPTRLALALLLLALSFFADHAHAQATCTIKKTPNNIAPYQQDLRRFEVEAAGVDASQVPRVCGALWKEVRRLGDACKVPSGGGNGAVPGPTCMLTEGEEFRWGFTAGGACDGAVVEGVWGRGTEGRFGEVKCEGK